MLEQTSVRIRRRSSWQATELAWPLVQRNASRLYAVWLLVVLPVWLLVTLATVGQTIWCLLLLWWLRPWFDVPLVRTLGSSVFSPLDLRAALRGLPGALLRSLLPALSLDRVDPARSSNLPVRQLEQLSGRVLLRRYSVLGAQERGVSVAWTVGCWLLEMCLCLATALLLVQLSPAALEQFWTDQFDALFVAEAPALHWLLSLTWLLVFLLIEPLYVAGGLCLYLNRRTALEGWDIEIAFRSLARRSRSSPPSRDVRSNSTTAPSWLLLLTAPLAITAHLATAEVVSAAPDPPADGTPGAELELDFERVDREIQEILGDPIFGGEKTVRNWKLRWDVDRPEATQSNRVSWLRAMPWLGRLLEVVLWIALAAALVTLLVVAFGSMPARSPRTNARDPKSRGTSWLVAGLDVAPESLPDDVPAAARGLLDRHRPIEALSLLYRGALSQLVAHGIDVRDSWTELDCVRETQGRLSHASHGYLRRLTGSWTRAAYADSPPTASEVAALCSTYADFSPGRQTSDSAPGVDASRSTQ